MRTVFLDHQSSTPVLPEVLTAMIPFFSELHHNPSSLHQGGLKVRDAIEQARRQIAAFIHAESPESIILTSGGTEAANLAVKGVAFANQKRGKHIVVSAIEHPAVLNSAEFLETLGFRVTKVAVDQEGLLAPEAVADALKEDTILVCVQLVNQDVGSIQPIAAISKLTSERGISLYVDAAFGAGWIPIDVQALGISLLSATPHRFYGPKGSGFLYRNRGVRLSSLSHGGDQERGRRAGTENVPAIVGAGQAAEWAGRTLEDRIRHTAWLQEYLWSRLPSRVDQLALNGPPIGYRRISTNLNISAEFTEGEGQLLSLDMAGIRVASGTHCVSHAMKLSPVLKAIGVTHQRAVASIILSLGKDSTLEDMDYFVENFTRVITRLRSMSSSWLDFMSGSASSSTSPRLNEDAPTSPVAPSVSPT